MKKIYYLIYSPSFGDTLAATPTLRYLSQSHESKINVVTYNTHIFKHNPYVDECMSFSDFELVNKENITKYESFTHAGRRDGNGIEKNFHTLI
jgi:ADP-heptose:LPS heptosyltransferase